MAEVMTDNERFEQWWNTPTPPHGMQILRSESNNPEHAHANIAYLAARREMREEIAKLADRLEALPKIVHDVHYASGYEDCQGMTSSPRYSSRGVQYLDAESVADLVAELRKL